MWALLTAIPGLAKGVLGYLAQKNDTELAKLGLSRDVTQSVIQAEIARQQASVNFLNAAMNHPVWWVAWGLGVFPVMLYYACIFFVSTFPFWGWTVLKAPADALDFAKLVTGSMFCIGGASSLMAGIIHAWNKRV